MTLPDVLKMTRQKAFLSQEEFAREMGVSVITINRWENGKCKPNLTALKKLKSFCEKHGLSYETVEQEWLNLSLEGRL